MFGVAESGSLMDSTNGLILLPSLADQAENPLVGKHTQMHLCNTDPCMIWVWVPSLSVAASRGWQPAV